MMKKTDKQTLDMLRNEFAKSTENAQVPLKLQKESMVTMLKNGDAKTKDFSSKTGNKRNNVVMIRRIAMAAAVFVVVIVAAVFATNQGGFNVIKTESFYKSYNKVQPVMGAKSYDEIEKAVLEICGIKSANSGKQEADASNTVTVTNPSTEMIVGGYNEYIAQEASANELDKMSTDVLPDPNSGNNAIGSANADIIKDYKDYIYIVVSESESSLEQIKIVKANPAEEMQSIDPIILSDGKNSAYSENCIEIYIKNDMLIALMERETNQAKADGVYKEKSTIAITYDVSDPTAPVEIRRHVQDGGYISSGLYENKLRLVTQKSLPEFSQNAEFDMSSVIPSFAVNGKATQLNAEEIFIAVNDPEDSYLFVTVTDITNPEAEVGRLAILGAGKDVYNLADSIVASRGLLSVEADANGDHGSLTELSRFDITGTSIVFAGSYVTEGTLLNGNAVDEYNGYLRVATEHEKSCKIYVLNNKMELVFSTKDLLRNKSIDRVKFIDDRAYFISKSESSEEVWVMDVSNLNKSAECKKLPANGFVQMLSPISENKVLIITEYPSWTENVGSCAIYDVADAKNPVMISEYKLNNGYYYAMGADQRQALLDTEKNIFILPVIQFDEGTKIYYLTFDISENTLREEEGVYKYIDVDGFKADRCLIINDAFYTISSVNVTAYSTADKEFISSVQIEKTEN